MAAAVLGRPHVTHGFGLVTPPHRVALAAAEVTHLWHAVGLAPRPFGGCYDHLYTQGTPGTPGGETSETSPFTAVTVSSGHLTGLAGHRGSGTASIVRTPDGSHVVQLEDYDVSSGITLFLYVVPGANQEEPEAGSVNLGRLAENTGNRVVPIPAGTDLSGPQTVLIWCEPFSTPIAAANQV